MHMNKTTQITIRGLDISTKKLLQKKAALKGVSMNKLASEALQQAAGSGGSKVRYERMHNFLAQQYIDKADALAIQQAVGWLDKTSKSKQRRDEHAASL